MMHEGYFDKIFYRFWQVEPSGNNILANIFAIHGLGGHSFWFDGAARLFNKQNINFFSFDLPGFGQSKYVRGEIDSYKTWVSVSRNILENFLINFNINKPVFVLGHSMGALIAILLSKNVKANGWILSVPAFEGNPKTWPPFNFVIPTIIKALFNSKEEVSLPYGPEIITKNKEMQRRLKQDPLRVINVNARMYKHVLFLTLAAKKIITFDGKPVLMLTAGQDVVCSNTVMDKYFEQIAEADKSKKIYTNAFHDLFIEEELNQIVDDIHEWVKNKI